MASLHPHPYRRYLDTRVCTSQSTALEDYRNMAAFFTANGVIEEALIRKGVFARDARDRAPSVSAYVRMGLRFLDDALARSRSETSLVSIYYACLNLMKAIVAASDKHLELNSGQNRRHGLSRDPLQSFNPVLLSDDIIDVYPAGAFALLHLTLTGRSISGKRQVSVKDLLGRINCSAGEAELAGIDLHFWHMKWERTKSNHLQASLQKVGAPFPVDCVPVLKNDRWTLEGSHYVTTETIIEPCDDYRVALRERLNPEYFYLSSGIPLSMETDVLPMVTVNLDYTEEEMIIMLLFMLSSIMRYDPVFFENIRQSKEWSIVEGIRQNGIIHILRTFCAEMNGFDLMVTPGGYGLAVCEYARHKRKWFTD